MNQFIRINNSHIVNLDNVTEFYLTHSAGISASRTAIIINFAGDTALTIYDDDCGFATLKTLMGLQPRLSDLEV